MRSKVWGAVVGTLMLGGLVLSTPRAYAKCDATGADAGDKGYEINFENTPVAQVTKAILSDILGIGISPIPASRAL